MGAFFVSRINSARPLRGYDHRTKECTMADSISVARLNHAVLYIRDLDRSDSALLDLVRAHVTGVIS